MRVLLILSLLLNIIAANYLEEYEDAGDPCGDIIHWSVNPYNPYSDTLVIINPYE
jgi:hypothetical protein